MGVLGSGRAHGDRGSAGRAAIALAERLCSMVHLVGCVRHDLAVLPPVSQLHSLLFGRSIRSNRFIQTLILLVI